MDISHKLSLQYTLAASLLGEVPDELRAAAARLEDQTVHISFFFNDEITEKIIDDLDAATAGVEVKVPRIMYGEPRFERIEFPKPLPSDVGIYAFSRDTLIPRQFLRSDIPHYSLKGQVAVCSREALLGRIPPRLRAAGYKLDESEKRVVLKFTLNGDPSESDRALLSAAISQVSEDFQELRIEGLFDPKPYPQKIYGDGGYNLFRKVGPLDELYVPLTV
jgi:hypothetical protein